MKQSTKKLRLNLDTVRNFQLGAITGGRAQQTAWPCTYTEVAGGCTVTADTCRCSFLFC